MAAASTGINTNMSQVAALALDSATHTQLSAMNAQVAAWLASVNTQFDTLLITDAGSAAAGKLISQLIADQTKVGTVVGDEADKLAARATTAQTSSDKDGATATWLVWITMPIALILLITVSVVVTRSIVTPMKVIVDALHRVSRKDLTVSVEVKGSDEIATMGSALNTALGSIRSAVASMADSTNTLAAASEEMSAVSVQLGHSAETTNDEAGGVSAAARQVSGAVGNMSAATEQMTASISEISSQTTSASGVASEAVAAAGATSQAVGELAVASQEIGEIVRAITNIAEQTNLLALNATIEAARAGDAGKGFAVVASEVKDLAQETARATDDITNKIGAIQATTARATEAIGHIASVISTIHEKQTTIAAAVEEQTATTSEIARSVADISAGADNIAESLGGIASASSQTAEGARSTQDAATDLSSLAANLKTLVHQFTY
jgi:methyl-accepting chemotaxis protein